MRVYYIMKRISPALVTSLKTLGLFESEAKVYSALVMFKYAEAKDLVEFLDVSKPSVYESLRTLEERGLVVETNNKPLIYQAIPPEIAVRLLADVYTKAADEAVKGLQALERSDVKSKSSSALWSIYGRETVGYKIEDMVRHATVSIHCLMPDKYLRFFEPAVGRGIKIMLTVITKDPGIKKRLIKIFEKDDAIIEIITPSELIDMSARFRFSANSDIAPKYMESLEQTDFGSQLMLITDDSEFLFIPPLAGEDVSALNTTNRAFIMSTKFLFAAMERKEAPPQHKNRNGGQI
jgi:sugar-specific transcriptional regulator TrmB